MIDPGQIEAMVNGFRASLIRYYAEQGIQGGFDQEEFEKYLLAALLANTVRGIDDTSPPVYTLNWLQGFLSLSAQTLSMQWEHKIGILLHGFESMRSEE